MLHLTPAMLEGTYELLRLTAPFKAWKLPHADELEFRVTNHADRFGHYDDKDGKGWPDISISARHVKNLKTLTEVMAHEMVHIRQSQGTISPVMDHGREFMRLADQVCRRHGFDRAVF